MMKAIATAQMNCDNFFPGYGIRGKISGVGGCAAIGREVSLIDCKECLSSVSTPWTALKIITEDE